MSKQVLLRDVAKPHGDDFKNERSRKLWQKWRGMAVTISDPTPVRKGVHTCGVAVEYEVLGPSELLEDAANLSKQPYICEHHFEG